MRDLVPGVVMDLLRQQEGIISRRQVLAAGGSDVGIERLVRRRFWAAIHRGVYVDHTGTPTWLQRAWGAVLLREPAALDGAAALRLHGLRTGAATDSERGAPGPAGRCGRRARRRVPEPADHSRPDEAYATVVELDGRLRHEAAADSAPSLVE